jgi:hypothetical protein
LAKGESGVLSLHAKAVLRTVAELKGNFARLELSCKALGLLSALWTVLAHWKGFPKDAAWNTAAFLWIGFGFSVWARQKVFADLRRAARLAEVAESLGELPLTPAGLVDWERTIGMLEGGRGKGSCSERLERLRFLWRCLFGKARCLFLRPDWCVWL